MNGTRWWVMALTVIAVLCIVIALLLVGVRLPAPPVPVGLVAVC